VRLYNLSNISSLVKVSVLVSLTLNSGITVADENKIQPLSDEITLDENFLLFLADTSDAEGDMIDPLDMLEINDQDLNDSSVLVNQEKENMKDPMIKDASLLNDAPTALSKESVK